MSALHLAFLLDLDRAHASVARRFDAGLGALHGIGLTDLHLLHALDRAPERKLRRIDLAQQLGVTASGVTWMLRPLTKRRLVTSEPSPTDARVAYAVLTAAGHELVADALPSARRLAEEILDGAITKRELEPLAAAIAKLG